MKRILVIIPSYEHGGTNRSLTNIIDLFDFDSHDCIVDLLCIKSVRTGPYFSEYGRRNIKILQNNRMIAMLCGNNADLMGRIFRKLFSLLDRKSQDTILKIICLKYSKKYDTVISMEEGISTRIASFINSEKHIAWVRSMFQSYSRSVNVEIERSYYYNVCEIVCVSLACKKDFISLFPELESRTTVIHNMQNFNLICCKANEKPDFLFSNTTYNIVSIGRLEKVKQFDCIPDIVDKLIKQGMSIKWYIIGNGNEKATIENKIRLLKLENNVVLLGEIDNPYPYIKMANLVAVTSVSESFCNVIVEAGILKTEVISTDFPAVQETKQYVDDIVICKLTDFTDKISNIYNKEKKMNYIDDQGKSKEYITKRFIAQLEKVICYGNSAQKK